MAGRRGTALPADKAIRCGSGDCHPKDEEKYVTHGVCYMAGAADAKQGDGTFGPECEKRRAVAQMDLSVYVVFLLLTSRKPAKTIRLARLSVRNFTLYNT